MGKDSFNARLTDIRLATGVSLSRCISKDTRTSPSIFGISTYMRLLAVVVAAVVTATQEETTAGVCCIYVLCCCPPMSLYRT